jgi:hypothetical protein
MKAHVETHTDETVERLEEKLQSTALGRIRPPR